ncbi:MAG: PKD domain-containing protein, partial [Bacteroidia bacterium]|nr:PKD domain-containing protein [Bacteroidia bacterium]
MRKNYSSIWLSKLLLLCTILLAGNVAMGGTPLKGTYTIDSASSTSGSNFQSFTDFVDSLDLNGISGSLTVNVVKGSGPYNEQVVLSEVTGASSKSTITINGNGETVFTTTGAVFELDGADYITLSNLKIDAQGTGNDTRCIHIWNGSDYNKITECDLIISEYTGTSNSTGYVVFSASDTRLTAGEHGNFNSIDGNTMSNGGSTSGIGPYSGCSDYRSNATTGDGGNSFTENEVADCYYAEFYMYYCKDAKINGNDMHSSRSGAFTHYPVYYWFGQNGTGQIQVNDNEIHDMGAGYQYGLYLYQCSGSSNVTQVNRNHFYDNSATNYLYGPRPYFTSNVEVIDNLVDDNSAGFYVYGIDAGYGQDIHVEGNVVSNNTADYGVYGFNYYSSTGNVINNIYVNNEGGFYNYGFVSGYQTTGNLNVAHNTCVLNTDPDYYNYGFYQYHFGSVGSANLAFRNNIVYLTGNGAFGNYPVYGYQYLEEMDWDHNDFYVNNGSTTNYYATTAYTTLASFNNYVKNTSNIDIDPKFKDLKKGDVTPTNPAIANYGVPGHAKVDFFDKTRTACGPDLGAIEFYVDHNASDLVFTGKNECGGYSEEITFNFNNGTDVDLINARAFYSINGGDPVIEEIAQIDGNSSVTYTFEEVPVFHEPSINTIEVGLLCDDNERNNVLTTTIDITPAPHSFELMADEAAYPGYYRAGSTRNPDVTVPGVEVEYDINNPSRYDNGRYGTSSDWSMVVDAYTENGTMVTSGITLTDPMSGTNGTLAFDPDPAMADSTIFLALTVTDHKTGCDSTFGRWIYVPHTPVVAWDAPDACDGDIVAFVNGTKQETGAVEYMWDFGDPASGTEDNASTISDPVHRFSTYGTYTVTVDAWNFDYPKFVYTLSKQVSISPVPTVDFKVTNACEGQDIVFANATT